MRLSTLILLSIVCNVYAMEKPVTSNGSRDILSSTSGNISVIVNNNLGDSTVGRFTIGTAEGTPLMFGHGSDPWSSFVRAEVDGESFVQHCCGGEGGGGERIGAPVDVNYMTLVTAPVFNMDGSISTSYLAGEVVITQIVTPGTIAGQDLVSIEYEVEVPASRTAHDVRLLLEIDTQIGENDAAPIATSFGYTGLETCFEAPVPNTWTAFEEGPDQGDSLLVGCGILNGSGAVAPDRFAIGSWPSFSYESFFDYECSGSEYGDSAVLLWWDLGTLNSGDAPTLVRTYYGTCTHTSSPGELNVAWTGTSSLWCGPNGYEPNPIDVNVLVTNTGEEACTGVSVFMPTVDCLYPVAGNLFSIGELAPGATASVSIPLVYICDQCDIDIEYTIIVSSDDCPSNELATSLYVPCCNVAAAEEHPLEFALGQNYPNPFNPTTTIDFSLAETGIAHLAVYNMSGQRVAVLVDGMTESGHHSVSFDATTLCSGVYFYTLQAGDQLATKKLVLMK